MSADLVTRLRELNCGDEILSEQLILIEEAADAIEKLSKQNGMLIEANRQLKAQLAKERERLKRYSSVCLEEDMPKGDV